AAWQHCSAGALCSCSRERIILPTAPGGGARDETKGPTVAHVGGVRGGHAGLADRIGGVAREQGALRRRSGVYRETVRELHAPAARDRADLGIHRSQVTAVAKGAAYGA